MGTSTSAILFTSLWFLFSFAFCRSSDEPQILTIDVHAAKNLIASGHRFLDVRTQEEFIEGHADVHNCLNIPYMVSTPKGRVKNDKFLEQVSSLCGMDDHLVVACQSGVRSVYATTDLLKAGFKHVSNMGGGYIAWENNGLSVKKPKTFEIISFFDSSMEGRSLDTTPTWAVATVVAVMVGTVFLFTRCVELFAKWLDKKKRKPLLAALDKIQEELMVFGVMSLLLGHWSIFVAKICIKTSVFGTHAFPCIPETDSTKSLEAVVHIILSNHSKEALPKVQDTDETRELHSYCGEGFESFASYESLEQLHRLLFVLGVTHITYSSLALALAVLKIYSWRVWENEAKSMALQATSVLFAQYFEQKALSDVLDAHQSMSRQFWSSISKSDYIALRFGFVTTHQLPMSYDFLSYMARSMHDEFRDIVGISVPLWMYAIFCIYLDFHGSHAYFWLSFLPAAIMMAIGTKLHHIVVKLALETVDSSPYRQNHVFRLRDELFWLRKPKLLLRLIQFISFQNALEMAMFLWSLWEISGTSCFMKNSSFIVVRLAFGVISQVWCSFITFPLYVIITQMGSRFKRTVITDRVRSSLHGWKKRVREKQSRNPSKRLSSSSSMPLIHNAVDNNSPDSSERRSFRSNERHRRLSLEDGLVFSSPRASYLQEDVGDESDDSYSGSNSDQYDNDDYDHGGDVRYFHLP